MNGKEANLGAVANDRENEGQAHNLSWEFGGVGKKEIERKAI